MNMLNRTSINNQVLSLILDTCIKNKNLLAFLA